MLNTRSIILASASPRRAQLLQQAGYHFTVCLPPLAEPELDPRGHPVVQAMAHSYFKARSVLEGSEPSEMLILAADTVVANEGEVFGKPRDVEDARRILVALTGSPHRVFTGLSLLGRGGEGWVERWIGCAVTSITMRAMSDSELSAYLDSEKWEGKAGAYGIQDCGDRFVTRIEGSFSNVVGLPMELLAGVMAGWGK